MTNSPLTIGQRLSLALIHAYQHTLSPDHGPLAGLTMMGCRFYPSCSEYTAQAIARRGVASGIYTGAKRIVRCNPWSQGGVDELLTTH